MSLTPAEGPKRWWDCRRPLGRTAYLAVGFTLMLLKYAGEASALWLIAKRDYTPLDFVNPLASARREFTNGGPEWLAPLWLLWTLPFVAIAVTFTIRRAIDAGRSPWWGMAILVPVVNFAVMALMAILPSESKRQSWDVEPTDNTEFNDAPSARESQVVAMLVGVGVAAVYAMVLTLVSVYAFHSYGAAVFFGTPVVAGAFAAFTYNFEHGRGWGASLAVSILPVLCLGAAMLMFAFEGAICILMAAPIMIPLALVGGALGKGISDLKRRDKDRRRELVGCLLALPVLAFGESRLPHDYEYCVVSSVDVAASPEQVWRHVVDFPEITSPEPWLFRLGIAGPKGARIKGSGVGAIRHCDFTTGSFTEPITVWDKPRRLAFDVTEQPEPIFELSPYRDVHPPHLHGSFRSTHGEFVLEELPGGGTRLIGHTWYKLELAPHAYWTIWTDWIVHRIHLRVLEHVKTLAENNS